MTPPPVLAIAVTALVAAGLIALVLIVGYGQLEEPAQEYDDNWRAE